MARQAKELFDRERDARMMARVRRLTTFGVVFLLAGSLVAVVWMLSLHRQLDEVPAAPPGAADSGGQEAVPSSPPAADPGVAAPFEPHAAGRPPAGPPLERGSVVPEEPLEEVNPFETPTPDPTPPPGLEEAPGDITV